MKVSVLMPTRNRAALLDAAIASVRGQTFAAHEVIVIDDGSDDDTSAVAARHSARFLQQKQGGKSKALNRGLREITGDAVIVLDDDDIFPPRTLERHVAALEAAPDADYSFGRFLRFTGAPPEGPVSIDHPDLEHVPTDDKRRTVIKLMEHCFLPNPAWMARREAVERAGPYDEEALRSQDFDALLRLARVNDGVFVDDVVLYQRQHAGVRPGVRATSGAGNAQAAWSIHDRRIFTKIARAWRAEDFRPFASEVTSPIDERIAWLQKGALMFQRGCFDEAFEAFSAHARALGAGAPTSLEVEIVHRTMLRDIAPDVFDAERSLAIAAGLRGSMASPGLRRAIVQGGRWHIGAAARAGDFSRALALTRFMLGAFGVAAATALASRGGAIAAAPAPAR